MFRLTIVVPCFNEGANLSSLHQRFCAALGDREDIQVIYVDNGSQDDSPAIFSRLLEPVSDNRFRVVRVSQNRGYGHGIKAGLAAATTELLAWTHADEQTDPGDAIRAFDTFRSTLETGSELIKGRRTGRGILDVAFTQGMSLVTWAVLGVALTDINAQPKIFSRKMLGPLEEAPDDFSLDVYLLWRAKRENVRIRSLPVRFGRRLTGESKGGGSLAGKVKLVIRTWRFLWALRARLGG